MRVVIVAPSLDTSNNVSGVSSVTRFIIENNSGHHYQNFQQGNAYLKSENTRLKMQAETQDSRMREKDGEVLRLLNQIATDMIRKSDVDRLVAEAVAKVTADYEERMKSMAAEYEARIAELQSGKGNNVNPDF